MSGDPVPAVTEAAATGETAALFADIRATLGVSVVNLVWRHLATMPGALPWVWTSVRPLYGPGILEEAAAAFRREMTLPPLPAVPADVLEAAGLSAVDRTGIGAVLASYDHSNTINLLALGALLRQPQGGPAMGRPDAAPAMGEALPRLLAFQDMAPATAALVQALNLLGERDEGRIVASMWRHLSHWPPFLALAWTLLAPLHETGALERAILDNLDRTAPIQSRLAGRLGRADAPEPAVQAQALAAVRTFVDHPIGKMVTTCRILRQALGPLSA